MSPYKLYLNLTSPSKIDYAGETMKGKFFKVLNLGYTKFFIEPNTDDLVDRYCFKKNKPLVACKAGLKVLTNKMFEGLFKIKEVSNPNEAIITAIDNNGTEYADYTLRRYDNAILLYDSNPDKVHREMFLVEDGNNIKKLVNDLFINPISNITGNTTVELVGSTDYNETTESWTETVTKVINTLMYNINDTISSTYATTSSAYASTSGTYASTSGTDASIEGEESSNTNAWLIVGGVAVASAMIGLGCYWLKKWQNSKTTEILGNNNEKAHINEKIPLNILENSNEEAPHTTLDLSENINEEAPLNILENSNEEVQYAVLNFSGNNDILATIYEEPELDLSGSHDHIYSQS